MRKQHMRYLVIDRGQMVIERGPLELDDLQKLVGGLIQPAFTVDSVEREGYCVTGYVNEESGDLPVNVLGDNGAQVYAGPLIVTGLDPHGETCELIDGELEQIGLARPEGGAVPTLIISVPRASDTGPA